MAILSSVVCCTIRFIDYGHVIPIGSGNNLLYCYYKDVSKHIMTYRFNVPKSLLVSNAFGEIHLGATQNFLGLILVHKLEIILVL